MPSRTTPFLRSATEPVCDAAVTSIAASGDFQRARRRDLAARAWRRLTGRRPGPTRPRHLGGVAALFWCPARRRSIPLEAIVGTVDATVDFDADFRPTTDRVRARWQRVAHAHRDGRPLPPVAVIERPDGYYVLDGRHRVSVARALGHHDIDAWVSPAPADWQAQARHAPTSATPSSPSLRPAATTALNQRVPKNDAFR